MPLFYSVYLDLVRIIAALIVFTGHGPKPASVEKISSYLYLGHDAVIVFFVLSGYVISYVVDQLEKDWFTYVVHRMARILPVAIAALLIAFFLDSIASAVSVENYPRIGELKHNWWWYFPLSLTFLNQAWWLSIYPFSDGPYWSLSYEVWDYVFFGILTFTQGSRRLILASLVFLIMGLKFIIMLPIWFSGVFIYRLHKKYSVTGKQALFLTLTTFLIYAFLKQYNPGLVSYHWISQPIEEHMHHGLDGANNFAWDYLLTILFGIHIFAIRGLNIKWLARPFFAVPIRKAASYTFSLYLYHVPIMFFFMTLLRHDMNNVFYDFIVEFFTLVSVIIFAHYTEHRKAQSRKIATSFLLFLTRKFEKIKIFKSNPVITTENEGENVLN